MINRLYNKIDDDKIFYYRTKIRYYYHRHRYKSPAHPYTIIHIDPSSINFRVTNVTIRDGLGQLQTNKYNLVPVEDVPTYKSIIQRFDKECDWENTEIYQKVKNKLKNTGSYEGYQTLEEFRRLRCGYVDKLFKNIKTNGYKPNYTLEHDVPRNDSRNSELRYRHVLEPLIAIDCDGEIYAADGFHRLAIATVLNLSQIPVNVISRHKNWQLKRDLIKKSNPNISKDYQLKSHPDIVGLSSTNQTTIKKSDDYFKNL